MTAPQWTSVDPNTADLLDLLAADWTPWADEDRNLIARAIRDDAAANGGRVDPNRVRRALAGQVKPQRVGPVYRLLAQQGVIRPDGWVVSDDKHGRNSGRPVRVWIFNGENS